MGLLEKYLKLHDAATSPRAADCGARAVFLFRKHCKRCRAGLSEPKRNARRILRALFRTGYCSEECRDFGATHIGLFPKPIKSGHSNGALMVYPAEKSAFAAVALKNAAEQMTRLQKLVIQAETTFSLKSEKLSFMEFITGERWSAARYYYHLSKAGV